MKFSTVASASVASFAVADAFKLKVSSDDNLVSGFASSIHEGAGINYLLVAPNGDDLLEDGGQITSSAVAGLPSHLGVLATYLALGPAITPALFTFDNNGELKGDKPFYACNNVNDPYDYSQKLKIIMVADSAPNDSCVEVKLSKDGDSGSGSAASSAAPSSAAPSGWSNASTTVYETVTGYTTYCPESTVVTITTCENQKCAPTAVTVTEATTLTVTGECVVPATSAPTSAAPVPSTLVSSAASSSAAPTPSTITPENGAQKMAAGFAGLAGAAAALML